MGGTVGHQPFDIGVGVATGGIAQDEGGDPFRIGGAKAECRPPSHRLADERDLFDLEMVEQSMQIIDEGRASRPVADVSGVVEAAMVEGHALEVF